MKNVFLVIPARNEAESLSEILPKLKKSGFGNVVVVDNGSVDNTFEISKKYTNLVIKEPSKGYGKACMAGIRLLNSLSRKDIIVCFFDGDGQSQITDIKQVILPVLNGEYMYSQGTRMLNYNSRITLSGHAYIANRIFSLVISKVWGKKITDLGPLRCLPLSLLNLIDMKSKGYSWTIEMNSKLAKMRINQKEIKVDYKQRKSGKSKISGNLISSLKASGVMSLILVKMIFWRKPKRSSFKYGS